jgi:hypothetical protein
MLLGLIGALCAVVWLLLLVATSFNSLTIGIGLLIAVCVTGRSAP